MKHYIFKASMFVAIAAALAACDENAWNDHLDGFDGAPAITDVKTIEYTLTDADYAAISTNATNKALAESKGLSQELAALSTSHCFTEQITAAEYVPAFLSSSSFKYFTLSSGSAVKLTYNEAEAAPAQVDTYAAASTYTLTTDDYIMLWGSDDNFINGFAPSLTAAKNMQEVLGNWYDDAEDGSCVIVTYQQTDQEPIFGNVGDAPEKTYTNTKVSEMAPGTYAMVVDGNAAYTQDASKTYGYLYVYQVEEDGTGISLDASQQTCNFTFTAVEGGYTITDAYGRYMWQTGTYNSFQFTEESPADGSEVWTVEPQTDGTMKITNKLLGKYIQYDAAYTSYGSYDSERGALPTFYLKNEAAKVAAKAPVAQVPLTTLSALWQLSGSKWSEPADAVLLQLADYTAMGQTYANLSGQLPQQLLPIYMAQKYPYAQEGDQKFVLYQYYNGSATAWRCSCLSFDGSEWAVFGGQEEVSSQFVLSGSTWAFDPSVTINLPYGRGETFSAQYYQACVDWVYEKICVPLGSTGIKTGFAYVTSYGNNEYYSGTSAYQNDVDIRADKAREQYAAGYEGMTNDQIVELMKTRFCTEVLPGALAVLHPDAVPVEGIDVIFTINFVYYDGANHDSTVRYKVTAPGTFEFIDCNWWESGQPAQ